jgi:hypothetical protein
MPCIAMVSIIMVTNYLFMYMCSVLLQNFHIVVLTMHSFLYGACNNNQGYVNFETLNSE